MTLAAEVAAPLFKAPRIRLAGLTSVWSFVADPGVSPVGIHRPTELLPNQLFDEL